MKWTIVLLILLGFLSCFSWSSGALLDDPTSKDEGSDDRGSAATGRDLATSDDISSRDDVAEQVNQSDLSSLKMQEMRLDFDDIRGAYALSPHPKYRQPIKKVMASRMKQLLDDITALSSIIRRVSNIGILFYKKNEAIGYLRVATRIHQSMTIGMPLDAFEKSETDARHYLKLSKMSLLDRNDAAGLTKTLDLTREELDENPQNDLFQMLPTSAVGPDTRRQLTDLSHLYPMHVPYSHIHRGGAIVSKYTHAAPSGSVHLRPPHILTNIHLPQSALSSTRPRSPTFRPISAEIDFSLRQAQARSHGSIPASSNPFDVPLASLSPHVHSSQRLEHARVHPSPQSEVSIDISSASTTPHTIVAPRSPPFRPVQATLHPPLLRLTDSRPDPIASAPPYGSLFIPSAAPSGAVRQQTRCHHCTIL